MSAYVRRRRQRQHCTLCTEFNQLFFKHEEGRLYAPLIVSSPLTQALALAPRLTRRRSSSLPFATSSRSRSCFVILFWPLSVCVCERACMMRGWREGRRQRNFLPPDEQERQACLRKGGESNPVMKDGEQGFFLSLLPLSLSLSSLFALSS